MANSLQLVAGQEDRVIKTLFIDLWPSSNFVLIFEYLKILCSFKKSGKVEKHSCFSKYSFSILIKCCKQKIVECCVNLTDLFFDVFASMFCI